MSPGARWSMVPIMRALPRYVPDRAFPAYAFVPGQAPHPTQDPRGHSYGAAERRATPVDERSWRESRDYLWGVDLFNHGYPWEAHEAWEGLWRVAARHSAEHALLQGLIQCAAAAVKARAGQPVGVAKLVESSLALFAMVTDTAGSPYMGVDVTGFAQAMHAHAAAQPLVPESWPALVLSW